MYLFTVVQDFRMETPRHLGLIHHGRVDFQTFCCEKSALRNGTLSWRKQPTEEDMRALWHFYASTPDGD